MKYALVLLTLCLSTSTTMLQLYTFSKQTNVKDWRIVNDGVMGGVSRSSLVLTKAGHGRFSGHVSLDYNGGFASIQLDKTIKRPADKKLIVLRVKGDGKAYEFRLKGTSSQYESYVHQFNTTGEWETISLAISDFYPQFRGRKLNMPNFNFSSIEQMSFLIANKKEEDFELLIDWIGFQ